MGCPLFAGGMGAPGARGADDSASSPSVVRDLGGTWAGKKKSRPHVAWGRDLKSRHCAGTIGNSSSGGPAR